MTKSACVVFIPSLHQFVWRTDYRWLAARPPDDQRDLVTVDVIKAHQNDSGTVIWYDDNWERWEWTSVGYVPREKASMREAAIHLMIDYWRAEKSKRNPEPAPELSAKRD